MNKKSNSITLLPKIFEENVYLCDSSGKVLACRKGGRADIKNIFNLLAEDEKAFLRENLLFYGLKPLTLVEGSGGPIIIDCSLFPKFRVVTAIIPDFPIEDLAFLVQNDLSYITRTSPRIKEAFASISCEKSSHSHTRFVENLLSIHRGESYFNFYGKNNAEIAVMMSDMALSLSDFYGAGLEITVVNADDFDTANMPCITSFIFALSTLLLVARKYSTERKARLKLIFDEMGVCFEFGFKIAQDYVSLDLSRDAEELVNLTRSADSRFFVCHTYQDSVAFALRGYPWVKNPNSADLKERKTELIYYY